MFLSKKIIIALTLTGSVNAAVLNTRTSPKRRADQSCTAAQHGLWISYSVWIGVPYAGSADCDATLKALRQNIGNCITNWQCVGKDGDIQLWFNTPEDISGDFGTEINKALESRYPSVGSFDCPGS